jgi:hypothetical protein
LIVIVFVELCAYLWVFVRSLAGFNSTQELFAAVQASLKQHFVLDQGRTFNGFLAAAAANYKPLVGARVGTACCGDPDARWAPSLATSRPRGRLVLSLLFGFLSVSLSLSSHCT